MANSPEEMEPLKNMVRAALSDGNLSDWQRRFLTDVDDKVEKYGRNARFSDKQISKLYEILSSRSRPSARPRQQRPTQRRIIGSYPLRGQRGGAGAITRKGRSFARRMLRHVPMLTVLMIVFFYLGNHGTLRPELSSFFSPPPPAYASRSISLNDFTITDGDTIHLNGDQRGTRLVGFNTPETIKPQCSEERALGRRAKARLQQLVSGGAALELQRVPCSCAPGTEGTKACNHGRACAILRTNGRDVGQVLIAEGLAAPLVCGAESCPPTPRPWCS